MLLELDARSKDSVFLIALGDTHIGHRDADIELLKTVIDWIRENDAYVVLMGDLIDARVESYPGFNDDYLSTQEQVELIRDLLLPIEERVLALIVGNHELRVWKKAGVDIVRMMAYMLGNKPHGMNIMIKVLVGEQSYKVYAVHGGGMASTPAGKLNKPVKMLSWVNADVILYGHTHMLEWVSVPTLTDGEGDYELGRGLNMRYRYAVLTGSYLRYPAYQASRGGLPTRLGSPVIEFNGREWGIRVFSIP